MKFTNTKSNGMGNLKSFSSIVVTLIVPFFAFAQQRGVITPSTNNHQLSTNNTYAVVVGISDYQDPGIPDSIEQLERMKTFQT